MDHLCVEAPLKPGLADELALFWQSIFKSSYEPFKTVLAGSESAANRNLLFLAHENGVLAGTAQLTISRDEPVLGGLGEVGTAEAFRGRSIASSLCRLAADAFHRDGGQALFLATSNPAAFRVYHRLGWRKLANTNIMVELRNGLTPETFLADYYRDRQTCVIAEGAAADRIPMIPLIVTPHDWHVLDANLKLFSIRYILQGSCMGQYPRYAALRQDGEGTWFSAVEGKRRVVGLATVRLAAADRAAVDGFTHPARQDVWDALMEAALRWARGKGAVLCSTTVSSIDDGKKAGYERLGFTVVEGQDAFEFPGGPQPAVKLEAKMMPYRTQARAMGLKPGRNLDNIQELLEQVEGERFRS